MSARRPWTDLAHRMAAASIDEGRGVGASPEVQADMLAEIDRLRAALKAANDRADAAEGRLRRYEQGSYAGMLDRD